MQLVFRWHIDADADIERALMYDKQEEAARISQGVEAAQRILESWVLRSHGRLLDEQGVIGTAQLEAEYLEELPAVVEQVEGAANARMHVGVGAEASEALIACRIAEERGGDPAVVLYTPDLSEEARQLDEMSETEAGELDGDSPDDDGVVGGGDAGAGAPAAAVGMAKAEGQKEPGEATQVAQGQLSPTAAMPSPPPSASISASAPSPGGQPPQQGGGEPSEDDVLQAVGQTLEQFKAQLPVFEQMKQSNPQAYQAVMGMVEGMVAMAQQLAGGSAKAPPPEGAKGEPVKKSEKVEVPDGHKSGMKVPKGGSSCSNCCFLSADKKLCANTYFVEWNGGDPTIPEPIDQYCSDWYEPLSLKKSSYPELDPKSWHVQYSHPSGAKSYVTVKRGYTRMPSQFTQYPSESEAVQVLRDAAARGARAPEEYQVVQGVGEMFKEEVDPATGEASKVEREPHESTPAEGELSKVDLASGQPMMAFNEELDKGAPSPTGRHPVVLPPGSHGVGAKSRSVKVVEPTTGKATWHQVSTGQKLSGDGHPLSTRVPECPSADTPEKRAQDAGLVGVPSASKPGQTAEE